MVAIHMRKRAALVKARTTGSRRGRITRKRYGKAIGKAYAKGGSCFGKMIKYKDTFPRELVVTDRYSDIGTYKTAVSNLIYFRVNSMFDPDYTYAGHQPQWFDTLCGPGNTTAIYNSYCVEEVSYRVSVLNTSTSTSYYLGVFPYSEDGGVVGTTISSLVENGGTMRYITPVSGLSYRGTVSGTIIPAKLLGIPTHAAELVKAYNATPAVGFQVFLAVGLYDNTTGLLSATQLPIQIEMIFKTRFSDRNAVSQS